jgi:hypothetical protein
LFNRTTQKNNSTNEIFGRIVELIDVVLVVIDELILVVVGVKEHP